MGETQSGTSVVLPLGLTLHSSTILMVGTRNELVPPDFCDVLTSRHVSTTTDSGSALDVPEGCAEGFSVETVA